MYFCLMDIILALDYIGTGVFAISGALAAMNKRFDLFGIIILATVTAVGGGSLRDVLIGRTPVGWLLDINYAYSILIAVAVTIIGRSFIHYLRRTMFFFDAIGLALFTIVGVKLGLAKELHPIVCVMLGTLSACFGGVIRDILSNEVPLIFHKEIYASASLLGGVVFLLLQNAHFSERLSFLLVGSLVLIIRILSVRYHWQLPKSLR